MSHWDMIYDMNDGQIYPAWDLDEEMVSNSEEGLEGYYGWACHKCREVNFEDRITECSRCRHGRCTECEYLTPRDYEDHLFLLSLREEKNRSAVHFPGLDGDDAHAIDTPSPPTPLPKDSPASITRDSTKGGTDLKATSRVDMHYTISKDKTGAGLKEEDRIASLFREVGKKVAPVAGARGEDRVTSLFREVGQKVTPVARSRFRMP